MFTCRRFSALAALAFTFLLPSLAAAKTFKVTVGLIAHSEKDAEKDFAGLIGHLKSSPDVDFTFKTYSSYDDAYEAFKQKQVDFALVGAVKYAQAHFEAGAIPVVAEGGLTRGYIVVPKQSPVKTIKDLKGKRFGFGYKDSTSTHLIPLVLLSKNLIKENDLGKAEFLGADQDKIVEKLLAGEVDAVGVVESVYKRNADKLRYLDRSDPFPGSPLIAHKNESPKVIAAVRNAFMSYKGDPAQKRFAEGATKIDDSNFNMIRFLCKVLYGKTYV